MWFLNLLFVISSAYAQNSNSNCSFSQSNITANWTSSSTGITIQFSNTNLTNNHWTGIAFGQPKTSSSILMFQNTNNQVTVQTKSKTGGVGLMDSTSQATVQSANLTGSTLNALVTVPSSFDGVDLTTCNTWVFIQNKPIRNATMGVNTSFNGTVGPNGSMHGGHMGWKRNKPFVVQNVCPSQC